jgi:hypothetical protein
MNAASKGARISHCTGFATCCSGVVPLHPKGKRCRASGICSCGERLNRAVGRGSVATPKHLWHSPKMVDQYFPLPLVPCFPNSILFTPHFLQNNYEQNDCRFTAVSSNPPHIRVLGRYLDNYSVYILFALVPNVSHIPPRDGHVAASKRGSRGVPTWSRDGRLCRVGLNSRMLKMVLQLFPLP